MEEVKIIPTSGAEVVMAQEKAAYDIQIVTAKRYPRDVKRSTDNSIAIATMDKDTAQSCGYALPRGGKPIQGPSVHLARILSQQYGNLRVEAKVTEITHKQIVSQAVCFDLENNYAVKVEVRKSIMDKNGNRYKDDMVTVTGNAANAIAFRNAVFNVIPKSVTDKVYTATRNMLAGNLTTEEKLIKARKNALDYFHKEYGATEAEILKAVGKNTVESMGRDEIILLQDLKQALKDGDTTVEEAFDRKTETQKKAEQNSQKVSEVIKNQMSGNGSTKITPEHFVAKPLDVEESQKPQEGTLPLDNTATRKPAGKNTTTRTQRGAKK